VTLNRTLRWQPVGGIGLEQIDIGATAGGIVATSVVIGRFEDVDFGARYEVRLDPDWTFRALTLERNDGLTLNLESDGKGNWSRPGFERCIDIDIGVTPFTNTLPIRRSRLEPGVPQSFFMAWVPLDSLEPYVDEQIYTRQDDTHVHYAAADGSFEADITVDADGFVVDYPGLFRRI
jgi:hypothetical protein